MTGAATTSSGHQTGGLESHVDAVSLGLQAMAVLLVREREALTERASPQDLDTIARDKQAAVANVAGLYGLLREALETLTGSRELASGMALLKHDHPQLATRVDHLVELTRECQLANQENGALVHARLRGTRSMLDSLESAGIGPGAASTYGPVGGSLGALAGDRLTISA